MEKKMIVTSDDGKKFEVRNDGTLKEMPKQSSGGVVGAVIDTMADVLDAVIPGPSTRKK